MEFNYKEYRWFFTKSGKLVYGGKSAEQNEKIIGEIIKEKKDYVIMHTKIPGSPFAAIASLPEKISEDDLEETAVWTACFSRAWRSGLYKTQVDIFSSNQINKRKGMKVGTFGISGKINKKIVKLKLILINQKKVLRAVPEKTANVNTKIFSKIIPGKISKDEFAKHLGKKMKKTKDEILNALPSGGFKEIRCLE